MREDSRAFEWKEDNTRIFQLRPLSTYILPYHIVLNVNNPFVYQPLLTTLSYYMNICVSIFIRPSSVFRFMFSYRVVLNVNSQNVHGLIKTEKRMFM
jgi:hypothetical protein